MNNISFLPRWIHKWYAKWRRYFWLPCPICYRHFGGHETNASLMDDVHYGRCVCPACSGRAKLLNKMKGL